MIILTLCVFFVCPSCIFDPKCFSRKTPIWKLWTNLLQWVKSYGKHVKNLWTKNNGKWHSVIAMQMRKMRNSHNEKKMEKLYWIDGGILFFQKSLIFIEPDISVSDLSQIPFRCWILLRSECIWEERIRLILWIALFFFNFSSMWNQSWICMMSYKISIDM